MQTRRGVFDAFESQPFPGIVFSKFIFVFQAAYPTGTENRLPKRRPSIPIAAIIDIRPEFTKGDMRDEIVANVVENKRNKFEGQGIE